ncbi:MAG: Tn3 family transposase, partial [bacterium]|nr:Tn3 family transposase [bacterium]
MKRNWTTDELIDLFTITPKDFELIGNKTGATRLGFSILLKFFQVEACFPVSKTEIPLNVLNFIVKQLRTERSCFKGYNLNDRNSRYHKARIREYFGFRESTVEDAELLSIWLSENVECYDRDKARAVIYEELRRRKLEPPAPDRVERIVSSAIKSYESTLFSTIRKKLPEESLLLIDELLKELSLYEDREELKNTVTFNMLRSDPGRICLESVFNEINKLQIIRKLKLPDNLFGNIPPKVLKGYKQRVSSELLGEIRRHPDEIRYSLLAVFFWLRGREITDNLVELLIAIIHKIDVKAEKRVEKEMIKDLKKVSGKNSILRNMAELSVENPDGIIKDIIYPFYSKEILADLVKELKIKNSSFQKKVYTLMKNSYSKHYRRMLPELLDILVFKSNNDLHKPVINAIDLIKRIVESPVKFIAIDENTPISGIIKDKWKSAVIQKDDSGREVIEKINYEICVLQALREKLRCKEIWVDGADKYRNPEEDLPDNFDINRKEYYEALKQPSDVEDFIAKLQKEMACSLRQLNKTVLKNPKVRISNNKGGQITVTPFEAQKEPKNLSALKNELAKRWPMINLLDILKETDFYTDLTSQFKSSGVRESMDRETIKRRLLMALFSLGTNTGLKRIAKASNDPESFDELRYVKRKFINKDSLRNAIVAVVNNILKIGTNSIWGEGTSCASDSKKFGAWDQNLMTEWHIRYRGRGVMIYWHVEKNST